MHHSLFCSVAHDISIKLKIRHIFSMRLNFECHMLYQTTTRGLFKYCNQIQLSVDLLYFMILVSYIPWFENILHHWKREKREISLKNQIFDVKYSCTARNNVTQIHMSCAVILVQNKLKNHFGKTIWKADILFYMIYKSKFISEFITESQLLRLSETI